MRKLRVVVLVLCVIIIPLFYPYFINANGAFYKNEFTYSIRTLKENYISKNRKKPDEENKIFETEIIEFLISIEDIEDIEVMKDINLKLNLNDNEYSFFEPSLYLSQKEQISAFKELNAKDKLIITLSYSKKYKLRIVDEFYLEDTKVDEDPGFKLKGIFKLEPSQGSLLSNNIPWSLLIGLLSLLLLITLLVLSLKNQKQILEETQTQSELMDKLILNLNNYFNNNQPGIFLADINDKIRNIQNLQNNINQKVESINQSNNPARFQDTQELKASEPKISFLEYFNQLIRNRSRVSDDALKANYKLRNLDFENGQFRISQFLTNFWLYKDEIGDYYVIPSYSLLKPDFYKYFYEIRDYQNRINIKANVIVSIERFTRLITRDNQVFDVVEKGIMLCSD